MQTWRTSGSGLISVFFGGEGIGGGDRQVYFQGQLKKREIPEVAYMHSDSEFMSKSKCPISEMFLFL